MTFPSIHDRQPFDPFGLTYRLHPTKGWQYWATYGWALSLSYRDPKKKPSETFHTITTYNATWAEPEEDGLR